MKRTIVKQVTMTPDESEFIEKRAKVEKRSVSDVIKNFINEALNSNLDDFKKIQKSIESCETISQLGGAEKMILNYSMKFPSDYPGIIKLNGLIYEKFKTLCHEKRASEQNTK